MLNLKTVYPRATGVLLKFLRQITHLSKASLARDGRGGSKLAGSLRYYINKKFNRSLSGKLTGGSTMPSGAIEFNEYGKYLDEGVKGSRDSRRGGNSPYKFSGRFKAVNVDAIRKWCQKKGIPTGAAYPIAKGIYEKGIKRSLWFTKHMKRKYPGFVNKYTDAVAHDIAVNYANQIEKMLNDKIIAQKNATYGKSN